MQKQNINATFRHSEGYKGELFEHSPSKSNKSLFSQLLEENLVYGTEVIYARCIDTAVFCRPGILHCKIY